MGTSKKQLYKEYQKMLKEKGIRQLTNDKIEKMLEKERKNYE